MKVGILTMYYRRNYGGLLQSYALYKYLTCLGFDVSVIDYRENTSLTNYHPFAIIQIIFQKLLHIRRRKDNTSISTRPLSSVLLASFSSFKKDNLNYSQSVSSLTIGRIVNQFDVIIIGSDQVWSSLKYKRLVYFGEFGIEFNGKLISYAACTAYSQPPFYQRKKLGRLLSRFDKISVRDETTKSFARSLIKKDNISIVADPTLLYDFKDLVLSECRFDHYILAYILGEDINGGHEEALKKIKGQCGDLKVVAIVISDVSLVAESFADFVLDCTSPAEWVTLFANASFIYTDSFHGCLFSMKFHKPFIAYYNTDNRASRLLDIKQRFKLENVVSSVDDICLSKKIDYDQIDEVLRSISNYSSRFLNEQLS